MTDSLGTLWRPRFFYEGYAIHGDSSVPPTPVSHGCARDQQRGHRLGLGQQHRPDRHDRLGLLTLRLRQAVLRRGADPMAFEKGLHEVGDGVWAYLQPDGGWGWSNAGLVTGDGDASLLVDTLFDLRLTAEMLEAMRRTTPAAEHIGTVVNTHANGDHCYGNALVAGSEIISSARSAEEMAELPAETMAAMMRAAPSLGPAGEFLARIFAPFSFEGVPLTLPSRTFDGRLDLRVGDRAVSLLEVGPAHTAGDTIVHLPGEGVVFTGDILFHGGHPIVWAGPVANWIAACDRILALQPAVVVPGHGPLATVAAVGRPEGLPRAPDAPRPGSASTAACRPWRRHATWTSGRTPAGASGSGSWPTSMPSIVTSGPAGRTTR